MTYDEQVQFIMLNAYFDVAKREVHFPNSDEFFEQMKQVSDEALNDALKRIKVRDEAVTNN